MENIIRQFGEVRANGDDRKVKFIFSTDAPDRHRTVLNPEGWELDHFNKNGIAGYMHDVYGGILGSNPDDVIGKARAWVEDGKLMGSIEFEPKEINEKAEKIYQKIRFGSLNAVSVGFVEKGEGHRGVKDNGEDPGLYYFGGQELLEISVVNIPSNPEALKQRAFEPVYDKEMMDAMKAVTAKLEEFKKNEIKTDLTNEVINTNKMEKDEKKDLAPETGKVDVEVKLDASEFSKSVGELAELIKSQIPGAPAPKLSKEDEKTLGNYSIVKAIRQSVESQRGEGKLDGIELEMHQEAKKEARDIGTAINGTGIPYIALNFTGAQKRADLAATIDAAGGYTVATELPGFIDTLKNSMVSLQAGVSLMTGLQGDLSFPKASANSTAYWRSEKGVATQSDPTFTAVTMTPNRLTAYTEYTNQLIRQSSIDVERFVRENLFYSVANALETAVYEGSGSSNVPQGILNASVNDATHGSTNPTAANWANIVNMEQMVAVDNALMGKMAYIMKSSAAGKLKRTLKSDYQGGYIWENYTPLAPQGLVNGYPAYITNVFTNDTVLFGNWAEGMVGQWGGLDILVNPFTLDTYDTVRVIIAGYYDFAVRHAESFARINDLVVS